MWSVDANFVVDQEGKSKRIRRQKGQKGVSFEDGKSRILRGLSQVNTDQGTSLCLVPSESEKPYTQSRARGSIPPSTESANVTAPAAEEESLIARDKGGLTAENVINCHQKCP